MRGFTAIAQQNEMMRDAGDLARSQWSDDRLAIDIATKGAVVPSATTMSGAPIQSSAVDLIRLLGPKRGAFAGIGALAMGLTYDRNNTLVIPNVTTSATGLGFITQGGPIPFRNLVLSGTSVAVMKIAVGWGMTREMTESTNAVAFMDAAFTENVLVALDTLFLDAVASSAVRPQGMRNGLTPLTATSGGGANALAGDLSQLADAVAAIGGANVAYACSVKDWIRIRTLAPLLSLPIFPTGGLAAGSIVCVAVDALAVVGSNSPIRVERSNQGAVHFEDTSPTALSTPGSPATVAAPISSPFQTDLSS